jgi:NDP-sugar pyrophosphorylase family protein
MVMRQGLLLALLGIAAGLAIALAATPQLAPLLYRVSPTDPVSIAGAALFLVVAVSSHAPEIVEYVNTEGHLLAVRSGAAVTCLMETKPLGTIGAARLAVGGFDALLVVNVDNLTTLPLRALVEHHFTRNSALTIASHREPFRIPFGELVVNDGRVLDYREKPVFKVLISSGTYVLSPEATGLIEPERRFDITDLFSKVRKHALRISAFEHDCTWVDVNDAESLKRATDLFGNQDYVDKAHA